MTTEVQFLQSLESLITARVSVVSGGGGAPETPVVTSISPASGGFGTTVTLTGTGFDATQGSGVVYFSILGLAVTSWSDTSIVGTAPNCGAGIGSIPVIVQNSSGNQTALGAVSFTYT